MEFYKLLARYQAGSKIVVWHFRGIQRVECVLILIHLPLFCLF